jgi:ketosteroid isomerase-like protein
MEHTMANREAMRALIEQAYAARGKGDIEGLMAAFHPDAVFALAGEKKTLAIAGAIEGHSNVRDAMTGFIASFEFISRDIVSFVVDGDRAAVHSRLKARFVPKDTTFTSDLVDMFKFRDGKVIELIEFIDTALVSEIISA